MDPSGRSPSNESFRARGGWALLLVVLGGCDRAPWRSLAWGEACEGDPPLSSDGVVWTSLGETYFQADEGVTWVTSAAEYAALWSEHTESRPIEPDFAVQKLLYAQVNDRQSCFQPVLETEVGVTADGSAAFLVVYDDHQDCDSIRDFAALFVFDASAEVTPCVAMIGP